MDTSSSKRQSTRVMSYLYPWEGFVCPYCLEMIDQHNPLVAADEGPTRAHDGVSLVETALDSRPKCPHCRRHLTFMLKQKRPVLPIDAPIDEIPLEVFQWFRGKCALLADLPSEQLAHDRLQLLSGDKLGDPDIPKGEGWKLYVEFRNYLAKEPVDPRKDGKT